MSVKTPFLFIIYVFMLIMGSTLQLNDNAKLLSYLSGITGLFLMTFLIELDRANKKFDVMNPKYVVMIGFSIFIFIGMIKFAFDDRNISYGFTEVFIIILLCYVSISAFLITMSKNYFIGVNKKRINRKINYSKLCAISLIYFIISNVIVSYALPLIGWYSSEYFSVVSYAVYAGPVSSIYAGYMLFIKKVKLNLIIKISLLAIFISGFILGTSRTPITYILISLLFLYIWHKFKSRLNLIRHYKINTGKVLLIAAVILFVAGVYKASNIIYEEKSRISDLDINYAVQHGYRFEFVDAFQNIFLLKNLFIDNGDFFYGETILAAFVNPIPRFIWKNKPKSLGYLLPERLQGKIPTLSLSTSYIGEFFVNFSYPGPIIGYFLLAVVASYYYKKYRMNSKDEYFVITYSVFLVLMLLESRGDFLTINVRGVSYIFITWFGLRLSSTKIKSESIQ